MAGKIKDIAEMTGLKLWKVQIVLAHNASNNLHRVTDEEIAIILHAAAELGYSNPGRGGIPGTKENDVTHEMVAKRARVSISTVSFVISGSGSISQETKEHVLHIAKELGYKTTFQQKLKKFYYKKG